ncbi:hypothetical protein [Ideonella sp.]|uniref:hypothetical protein n=1 Tax=Ideonella sp. TaxID=1929293 RepID=UPI003BB6CABE
MSQESNAEIAAMAARMVVEEGMEYTAAKRKAARDLGRRSGRGARSEALPSNEEVEDEVREYIDLFCADSQPRELQALRELALRWMERLPAFRPHLGGAVWRGTGTRLSNLIIDLYCDDPKTTEISFLNLGLDFDSSGANEDEPLVLSTTGRAPGLPEPVTLHFVVHDLDDLRGALKADARGRTWRGDAAALRRLMEENAP